MADTAGLSPVSWGNESSNPSGCTDAPVAERNMHRIKDPGTDGTCGFKSHQEYWGDPPLIFSGITQTAGPAGSNPASGIDFLKGEYESG